MKTIEEIKDAIEGLGEERQIALWNDYASENCGDSLIYKNDEGIINDMFCGNTYEAIRSARYGRYEHTHGYFCFNENGNLHSFDFWNIEDESAFDYDTLSEWLMYNKTSEEIEEIFS